MKGEIRFSGFGGQGIILMGYVFGKALAVHQGLHAVLTQSYGPEARGGASAADVVFSDQPVDYPKVRKCDILVCMSQDAYETYHHLLKESGMLLYDAHLVEVCVDKNEAYRFAFPATDMADRLVKKKITANMVMLGALCAITGIPSREALEESIRTSLRKELVDLNLNAMRLGYEEARKKGYVYEIQLAIPA
ncbi:MAG: 2-oxoacid:acceptor oxidoreductase family protein [bacterium JZ-2024 1]